MCMCMCMHGGGPVHLSDAQLLSSPNLLSSPELFLPYSNPARHPALLISIPILRLRFAGSYPPASSSGDLPS